MFGDGVTREHDPDREEPDWVVVGSGRRVRSCPPHVRWGQNLSPLFSSARVSCWHE